MYVQRTDAAKSGELHVDASWAQWPRGKTGEGIDVFFKESLEAVARQD